MLSRIDALAKDFRVAVTNVESSRKVFADSDIFYDKMKRFRKLIYSGLFEKYYIDHNLISHFKKNADKAELAAYYIYCYKIFKNFMSTTIVDEKRKPNIYSFEKRIVGHIVTLIEDKAKEHLGFADYECKLREVLDKTEKFDLTDVFNPYTSVDLPNEITKVESLCAKSADSSLSKEDVDYISSIDNKDLDLIKKVSADEKSVDELLVKVKDFLQEAQKSEKAEEVRKLIDSLNVMVEIDDLIKDGEIDD